MNKKQFDEIMVKIKETEDMINKAKDEAIVSIDSRIEKLITKMTKDIPKFWKCVSDCGMSRVTVNMLEGKVSVETAIISPKINTTSNKFAVTFHEGGISTNNRSIFYFYYDNKRGLLKDVISKTLDPIREKLLNTGSQDLNILEETFSKPSLICDLIRDETISFKKAKNEKLLKELQDLQMV